MTDMRQLTLRGRAIEEGSFAVIDREAGSHAFTPAEWQVVQDKAAVRLPTHVTFPE